MDEPTDVAPDDGGAMETMSSAVSRLQAAGYHDNLYAVDGGHLRCGECDLDIDPADATVDEIVRFEGMSDPGDESILFALSGPGGHRGLYSVAYGADTPTADVAVMQRIDRSGERR